MAQARNTGSGTGSEVMDTDRVAPGDGCPKCGNDEVDKLEIVDDPEEPVAHVCCLRCGHFYRLKE